MKVLFAAYRNDPRDIDSASSIEYGFYSAMIREGLEVEIAGPFTQINPLVTRLVRKLFKKMTGKGYTLFPPLALYRAAEILKEVERTWKPDVLFSVMPCPLAFYSGSTPIVWRTDTTYKRYYDNYYGYSFTGRGKLAQWIDRYMQARSMRKASRIITASAFCKYSLMFDYEIPPERIDVLPNPSAIPMDMVPEHLDVKESKRLTQPMRLLFVGRDGFLKGLDIAVETVQLLNSRGIQAELAVCSRNNVDRPNVRWVGTFTKSDPAQLQQYVRLYQDAHLLIHPARYESAGIVPSEAAAFATPTITNDVGGLSTTVVDGVSGIVLRAGSPAKSYAEVIAELLNEPERYYRLCETTRCRYERELNWSVVGRRFVQILKTVASEQN